MRIIVDIAHPAHIHYFRNFVKEMEKRGHQYLMTLRGKDIIIKLANYYNLNYEIRSNINKENASKLNYALTSIRNIYKFAKKFKPDFFVDMGTIFAAPVAKFIGAPYIAFDDTEAASNARLLFMPFANYILTPNSFSNALGKKHIKFNGFMELFYLLQKYFKPDLNILSELGVLKDEKICILRFVSWEAFHDKAQKGFSESEKIELVSEISKRARVFISSESDLVINELKPFLLKIHPAKIHDLLAFSDLYIGEGATMASECAMLGTPAIYFNTINAGTINEQENYGLVFHYKSIKDVLKMSDKLLRKADLKKEWNEKRNKMLNEKIDMTAFLIWFVENYPESAVTIKKKPDFLYSNFKQNSVLW